MIYVVAVILIILSGVAYIFFGVSQRTISLQKPSVQEESQKASEEIDQPEEEREAKASSAEQNENVPVPKDKRMEIQESNKKINIISRLMKSGFGKSEERSIDTIVIHASYDALGSDPYSVEGVVREYEMYEVSAHYLIGRDGKIYQLVKDNNIAWHAGKSKMPDGRTNVNQFSIGIELIYTKKENPNSEQYRALKSLISSLKNKYPITYVTGHNQIAPDRKDDPWNFDWSNI